MRLPKLDTIVFAAFFVFIAFWMVSKCNTKRSDYLQRNTQTEEDDERPVRHDTVVVQPQPKPATPQNTSPAPNNPATTTPAPVQQTVAPVTVNPAHPTNTPSQPAATPSATTQQPAASAAQGSKYTTLFITIDGLKMRKEPGLKSETVAKLDLYEQVYFLNKRTDWTQEISLGLEKVTDHWVKVRTKAGKEGWVFGAGVNYYKEKRKGVLE